MKLLNIFLIFLLPSCACLAGPQTSSGIPASVNHIETHRINDHLLRIIKHNMELNPIIELELFETPDMKLTNYKKIEQIILGGRKIVFKDADAIYVDSINLNKNKLSLDFDYFPPQGDERHFTCDLQINAADIADPECK